MATYTTVDLSLGSFTIPAGVSQGVLYAAGAVGGPQGAAGAGGWVKGTLAVTAGQVVSATLGAIGGQPSGGSPDGKPGSSGGYGGGGSTTIKVDGTTRAIGPGGGGSGSQSINAGVGDGNYPNGGDGANNPGSGATQSADGSGMLGTNGGGGGGGYYKGGSGNTSQKSGGGGSGFIDPSMTSVSYGTGNRAAGSATFTYRNPVTPPAPTIIAPAAGGAAAAGTVRMSWSYGAEDTQAGSQVQWRVSGGTAGDPAVITDATPYTDQTLTDGDWEWRVQTTSQDGLTGPWSPWTPFHVETKPATPTITAPSDSDVLTDVPVDIEWTGAASAWQAQIVGPAGIIWDSGTQSGTDTSTTGQALVNSITVTVRVRLKATYVTSDWAQVTCTVDWVGPVAPVVRSISLPDSGALEVAWTQPETDPAVDHYEIVAVEAGTAFPVPGASAVDPDDRSFIFRLPLSDVDTQLQVAAVAASGAKTVATAP